MRARPSNVRAARAALAAVIARGDYWRRPPAATRGDCFKEWTHFCVLTEELCLLVNWSLSSRADGSEAGRLTLLARSADGVWEGDAEALEPSDLHVPAGCIGADLGDSRLRFRDGAYELHARLARRPLEVTLRLRPRSRPALTSSIPLSRRHSMKWFVVPRLEADGEVRIGSRHFQLSRAPAYHDHDWGEFEWGGDFSWEWAIAVPEEPSPSLIFQRISNRARTHTLSQGLLLWHRGEHFRTLHAGDLEVRPQGLLPAGGALRVPRVMSLVSPGRAADLPQRIELSARSGDDVLEGAFELQDLAQVAVPNDGDLGTSVISECHARAHFEGKLRGQRLRLEAPAIVELNRAEP